MIKKCISVVIVSFILFVSCTHREGGKTRNDEFKLIAEDVTKVIPELHSIAEIKTLFELAGVGYHPDLVNDPTNATKYSGKQKIAANLGVYMADMVYVISTKGENRAKKEYSAILELAKDFGFADDVLNMSYERYEEGNTSVEEFYKQLQQSLENSSKQMTESEVSEIHSYLIYGNYIEKLYLVSSLLRHDNKKLEKETEAVLKRDLLALLTNQVSRINEMIFILEKYPDQWSEVVELKDLQKLMDLYLLANTKRDSLLTLSPQQIYKADEVNDVLDQIELLRRRIVLY